MGPIRPPDVPVMPPAGDGVTIYNGPPPGFTVPKPKTVLFQGAPGSAAPPKPLWQMSQSELQAEALKQAQMFYQPVVDELRRQQRVLQDRNQASLLGLQKLIGAVQGSARGLGDETGRGLGDAFAGLAGQAGQEQYLTLSQNQDQALQDLLGQITKVAGEIPGQAQQIYGDLVGQVNAHAKATAPVPPTIRSVQGGLYGINPNTGKGGWIVPPPAASQAPHKFYTVGSDKQGRTVYDTTTGRVVARVPPVPASRTGTTAKPHYFKQGGVEYAVGPNGIVTPVKVPGGKTTATRQQIVGPGGAPMTPTQINAAGAKARQSVTNAIKAGVPIQNVIDRFTSEEVPRAIWGPIVRQRYGIPNVANPAQLRNMSTQRLYRIAAFYGYRPPTRKTKNGGLVPAGGLNKQQLIQYIGQHLPAQGAAVPKVKGRVPAEPAAQGIVAEAQRWLGTPYSWGGGGTGGPSYGFGRGAKTKGFDCSGFIQYLYGKFGVSLPRTTYDQIKAGRAVGQGEQLQPGDLLFFGTWSNPHHVGMYIGGGKFIESPYTGGHIQVSSVNSRKDLVVAKRIFG